MLGKFNEDDYIDRHKKMSSDVNEQMANLNILDNNSNYLNISSGNMKLRPVITKKTVTNNNRVNTLNTNKKVTPVQPQIRVSSVSAQKTPNNIRSNSTSPAVKKVNRIEILKEINKKYNLLI